MGFACWDVGVGRPQGAQLGGAPMVWCRVSLGEPEAWHPQAAATGQCRAGWAIVVLFKLQLWNRYSNCMWNKSPTFCIRVNWVLFAIKAKMCKKRKQNSNLSKSFSVPFTWRCLFILSLLVIACISRIEISLWAAQNLIMSNTYSRNLYASIQCWYMLLHLIQWLLFVAVSCLHKLWNFGSGPRKWGKFPCAYKHVYTHKYLYLPLSLTKCI